jgi:ABC-type Mn2+/Zn2+ transport system ATPase subunit
MRVTGIRADDCLSYRQLDLILSKGITTVTGPNSAGKSNLGRCVAAVLAAVGRYAYVNEHNELQPFESFGYNGSSNFHVAIGIELDQPWELDLLADFVRAVLAYGGQSAPETSIFKAVPPHEVDALMDACLNVDSIKTLQRGTLHVFYDGTQRSTWSASWEFGIDERQWHIVLFGSNAGQLRPGAATPVATYVHGFVPPLLLAMAPTERDVALAGEGSEKPSDSGTTAEPDDSLIYDFTTALPSDGEAVSFVLQSALDGSNPMAPSLHRVGAVVGVPEIERRGVDLNRILWEILHRGIVLTDNRRAAFRRRVPISELHEPIDLSDGSHTPALLHVLKNGDAQQRQRFATIQQTFKQLTGDQVDVRSVPDGSDQSEPVVVIDPVIATTYGDRPITSCGAGRQEALVLASLLSGPPGRLLVLDEPAANLEGVVQHRVIGALRQADQCLLITHSPNLVPIHQQGDLDNLVRFALGPDGTRQYRAPHLSTDARSKWIRRLDETDARALLFAHTVVLCEGETETAALPRWWSTINEPGLPALETTGIAFLCAGSDSAFGAYIEYLDTFGVRWAVVADGPALAPRSKLATQLGGLGMLPDDPPTIEDFEQWRAYLATAGVFTLANQFGTDGGKQGEFEAFLVRTNPQLFEEAHAAFGRSKPRMAVHFAELQAPPVDVHDLYVKILEHFDLIARR